MEVSFTGVDLGSGLKVFGAVGAQCEVGFVGGVGIFAVFFGGVSLLILGAFGGGRTNVDIIWGIDHQY